MNIISATDVTKTYGDVTALDGLSLSVESGATFGLLGTNGAGKSTLFKLLVGHIQPDEGHLEVAGMDVTTAGTDIRRYVGFLPEHAGFPGSLTGREVLRFHARMRGMPRAERDGRIEDVLGTVGLSHAADRAVAGYSNGMNRRLGLATALLPRPRILLLDEPTAGLDPLGVARFHRIIQELHEQTDLTVVLSSHVMGEVEKLCNDIAILHDGVLRASGTMTELKQSVGDAVTLHAELADPAEMDAAVEAARRSDGSVRMADGRILEVGSTHAAVPGLLSGLNDAVDLDGFEVREPGLEQVFERVVQDVEEEDELPAGQEVTA